MYKNKAQEPVICGKQRPRISRFISSLPFSQITVISQYTGKKKKKCCVLLIWIAIGSLAVRKVILGTGIPYTKNLNSSAVLWQWIRNDLIWIQEKVSDYTNPVLIFGPNFSTRSRIRFKENSFDPDPVTFFGPSKPVFRIRNGSVFRSFVDPDPCSEYGSRSGVNFRYKFTIQRLNWLKIYLGDILFFYK